MVSALALIGVTGYRLAAARLMGASGKLRDELGLAIQPSNQAEVEGNIAAVREKLGDDTFERVWAEGRARALDEAVAAALGKARG